MCLSYKDKFIMRMEGVTMTVDQAVKKFKLEPLNVYTAKAKAKEDAIRNWP